MLYPAFVEIDVDGSASGFFPDVTGCYFAGDTPEHTLYDAQSALSAHFELMAEKGMLIPEPSQKWITDFSQTGIWIYVEIDITRYLGKSERINITMPNLLIEKIDQAVGNDARYNSRSHFLAEAARKALSHS
ncbi:Predicted nuclease of the RNAse H fold, HicB family [Candidatus Pantoea symbiotica]|jgi:predicted RNase H-like HicB family nuclease|uniref:Predicted nuclease of the RNAse H fold, HicB family n=1 Tax=Candidatus Pantoea symbiotica TaxID=1884370 RepID=A0A1I3R0F6_9GAMM|nr:MULTISPECIES: type II toxin-antitoxin system HicB family antitoxin [Pantoea]KAJ9433437.1 type II toxin-antitoxin system HicB family antitoxin [Pantoea sp. YR343]MRT22911.1 type II toxin-antitoxin system HicB family antitoxin [Enterobacteriaceae bacterium RIT697]SFJ39510.1 Predicted nuclease of the RNAse H fold, HicB family [Pantoea symbiotica]SFU35620.1 Predicted nuclease of the RNAse H fold, HicB family [Pantoea sp. YR525]